MKRFSTAVAAAGCLWLTTGAAWALPAVALVEADPGYYSDVQTKLQATGLFSTVDVFQANADTPTLAYLQAYQSVLVWSDANFYDSTALGNVLDTYARNGGGVVTGVFANTNALVIGGAFSADLPTTTPSQTEYTPLSLGSVLVPSSPLLTGVTSFNGGPSSYHAANPVLNPGAVDVANWSDGEILLATQTINGYETVELNFFPVSNSVRGDFWDSSTDGTRIMTNALLYAGTPVPEPASMALIGVGVAGIGMVRRRRAKS